MIRQMVWKHVRPAHGVQVRRLAVMLGLAIAIPRVLNPTGVAFIVPRLGVGWAFLMLALGLAVTTGRWRRQWQGRLAASIGFAMFVTLAVDAWSASLTSAFISMVMAWTMLGEAATHHDC